MSDVALENDFADRSIAFNVEMGVLGVTHVVDLVQHGLDALFQARVREDGGGKLAKKALLVAN